jgi:hypothetical protein
VYLGRVSQVVSRALLATQRVVALEQVQQVRTVRVIEAVQAATVMDPLSLEAWCITVLAVVA